MICISLPKHKTSQFDTFPCRTFVVLGLEGRMWATSRDVIGSGVEALDKKTLFRLHVRGVIPLVIRIVVEFLAFHISVFF